jgi:ubiquinone/menaquinone biosynthesis C-methylase UbiE
MKFENRVDRLNEFFNTDFKWWEEVYDVKLPKGFFSFEMIRRKKILLDILKLAGENSGLAILECGCGPGGILSEINSTDNLLAGVDINFSYLSKAQSDCDSTHNMLQADIQNLPFKNNSFDVTYCAGVLGYLEEDQHAIREICRVTKPGGTVIIAVQSYFLVNKLFDPYYYLIWMPQVIYKKLRNLFFTSSVGSKKYEIEMLRRYSYGQLDHLYRKFGLEKMETIGVSFGPPTFWRKDVLPLPYAIKISNALVKLSMRRGFGILTQLANHWVISLVKIADTKEQRS